ncbi:hypothetical protein L6164_032246 [Bauhinia variegata]|uniref:Uncharacterized protein n=1 Tax=Bauhinia variegata TaxID=167791 RepID=A0ACB9KN76_BAUVA|nr:hypothetical protein L6164_032246 [Bauhinia variegata]
MDKGWGLTLDSSSCNYSLGFFPSKQPANTANTLSVSKLNQETMFPPGLGFPVNLTRRDDRLPSDDDRVVDFFADRNKSSSTPSDHDDHRRHVKTATAGISVKKENSHLEPPHKSDLDVNTGLQLLTANTKSEQSTVDDGVSSDAEDKRAKNAEDELQRMNAENQRLKEMLSHVSSNYTALQIHLTTLMQQQQSHRAENKEHEVVDGKSEEKSQNDGVVPRQFLDLRSSGTGEIDDQVSNSLSDERTLSSTPDQNNHNNGKKEITREESPDSETRAWGPSNKVQKLNTSTNTDQSSPEATMRKARVSVRARSEAPMISDGCQWRKYGQKMAKGNPCPRAYYRCTMAVGCPVRKQVQRCAEDRTILITTYEGAHNHPLPPAAMAMANTTAAAATMLLSGSMSSADGIMNPNLLARAILPCSTSLATLSASAPFPTVTLDLTHNPNANPLQFQRPQTSFQVPFGSGPTPAAGQLPQVFAQALYNQSKFSGLQLSQDMASSQSPNQAPRSSLQANQNQPSLTDTVSAATAAITADPNFTAVLAAAISSIIGGAHPNNNNNNSSSNPNITNSTTISSFSGN